MILYDWLYDIIWYHIVSYWITLLHYVIVYYIIYTLLNYIGWHSMTWIHSTILYYIILYYIISTRHLTFHTFCRLEAVMYMYDTNVPGGFSQKLERTLAFQLTIEWKGKIWKSLIGLSGAATIRGQPSPTETIEKASTSGENGSGIGLVESTMNGYCCSACFDGCSVLLVVCLIAEMRGVFASCDAWTGWKTRQKKRGAHWGPLLCNGW